MCQTTTTSTPQQTTEVQQLPRIPPMVQCNKYAYDEDIFSPKKHHHPQSDLWNRVELKMISALVSFVEVALLLFATTRALVSIVNPKIQSGLYSLFILLPFTILLPALFGRVESASTEDTLDD